MPRHLPHPGNSVVVQVLRSLIGPTQRGIHIMQELARLADLVVIGTLRGEESVIRLEGQGLGCSVVTACMIDTAEVTAGAGDEVVIGWQLFLEQLDGTREKVVCFVGGTGLSEHPSESGCGDCRVEVIRTQPGGK